MLGRKDYTKEEYVNGKAAIDNQIAAYQKLARAVDAAGDKKVKAALAAFEPIFTNAMLYALDRTYVHRLRMTAGKDGNALNELELLVESMLNNEGIFRANNVIKYVPEEAVTHVAPGEQIRLNAAQFEELAAAFFETLRARFL